MIMGIHVNTSRFDAKIAALKRNMDSALESTIRKVSSHAEGRIKIRAPVDEGYLRASILNRPTPKRAGGARVVFPEADYGSEVEHFWKERRYHGSPKGPPGSGGVDSKEGYIADSVEETRLEVERYLADEVRKAIDDSGFRR